EGWCLRLVLGLTGLAAILVPASAVAAGPWGVGWAAVAVEATGAVAGWVLLARLGVAPRWPDQAGRAVVGCLGLVAACRLMRGAPLGLVCLAGVFAYAAA